MPDTLAVSDSLTVSRRGRSRRLNGDRRTASTGEYTGIEQRSESTRRKVERRRMIDPTTCERDYNLEEVEFMKAMDDYKRRSGRQFPTWSEVLEVLRDLGYRKTGPIGQTYAEQT